jgi:hypothetical protein
MIIPSINIFTDCEGTEREKKESTNYRKRIVDIELRTYHRLLHGALMPNNLQCTTNSGHQYERTQSFLVSEGAISNLHAGSKTKHEWISCDCNIGMELQTN